MSIQAAEASDALRIQIGQAIVGFGHAQNRRRGANFLDRGALRAHARQSRSAKGGSYRGGIAVVKWPAQYRAQDSAPISRARAAADYRDGLDGGAARRQRVQPIAKRER